MNIRKKPISALDDEYEQISSKNYPEKATVQLSAQPPFKSVGMSMNSMKIDRSVRGGPVIEAVETGPTNYRKKKEATSVASRVTMPLINQTP